jgi:hypothetical protein
VSDVPDRKAGGSLMEEISERAFQEQVVQFARQCGWEVFHVSDSRKVAGGRLVGDRAIAGFPDLTLVHPGRGFVFAELKAEKGKATKRQLDVLDMMAAAALTCRGKVRVHLWRPADMMSVIVPALRDGKGPVSHGW